MSIYDSALWLADLDEILDHLPLLADLEGKSVLITGAGSLVCSAAADLLIRYNGTRAARPVRILAAGRNETKIRARFGEQAEKPWFRFVPYDATRAEFSPEEPFDYAIHGAGNSSPDLLVREPVETLLANVLGLKALLTAARGCGAARLLYISTSEVYGAKVGDQPSGDRDYGFIDLLVPRNSYSVGKRAAENLCASWTAEYGTETVIARPGHIYGPTASPADAHVSSAWAYAAARGEALVMKSEGRQLRSYCYCLDCASALLTMLLRGESGRAYNISNPDSVVSIRRLAELLAEAGGVPVRMELPTAAERQAFNPMLNSSLDSAPLMALGWQGLFGAERGLAHTVAILRERERERKL